jgi:hypothetical protein
MTNLLAARQYGIFASESLSSKYQMPKEHESCRMDATGRQTMLPTLLRVAACAMLLLC